VPTYHGSVFSVSSAELVTIAVVALLVFGPKRLPEIARKAGQMLRSARDAAGEIRSGIESEYGDTLIPLREARDEIRDTLRATDGPPPSPMVHRPEASPEPPDPDGGAGG